MKGYYSDLNEVMAFREQVYGIQRNFLKNMERGCLVSFGMNIPGPVKTNSQIWKAYRLGRKKIEKRIRELGTEILADASVEIRSGLATVYLLGVSDACVIKREMVKLEETYPLGRLFDIDVIGKDGLSVSRSQLGMAPRKCLLCDREAKLCARSRRHRIQDLQQTVCALLDQGIEGETK